MQQDARGVVDMASSIHVATGLGSVQKHVQKLVYVKVRHDTVATRSACGQQKLLHNDHLERVPRVLHDYGRQHLRLL